MTTPLIHYNTIQYNSSLFYTIWLLKRTLSTAGLLANSGYYPVYVSNNISLGSLRAPDRVRIAGGAATLLPPILQDILPRVALPSQRIMVYVSLYLDCLFRLTHRGWKPVAAYRCSHSERVLLIHTGRQNRLVINMLVK